MARLLLHQSGVVHSDTALTLLRQDWRAFVWAARRYGDDEEALKHWYEQRKRSVVAVRVRDTSRAQEREKRIADRKVQLARDKENRAAAARDRETRAKLQITDEATKKKLAELQKLMRSLSRMKKKL